MTRSRGYYITRGIVRGIFWTGLACALIALGVLLMYGILYGFLWSVVTVYDLAGMAT